MKVHWLLAALAALSTPVAARSPAADGLKVERVVVLMRHGVRPPTKDPAMPAGIATEPWPTWPVAPGYLTPHGAAAVQLLAAADRQAFVQMALLPASGCPRDGDVRFVADSDQRTIATAEAYRDTLMAKCAAVIEHHPQGERDPLFSPTVAEVPLDPAVARAAVTAVAGPGGLAGAEAAARPALGRLDAILCGPATATCGVSREPTTFATNGEGRVKLAGALDRGSTGAQVLLLEYAEGKPMTEVGWGRATAADVARLSSLHALEFALMARPLPLARRNMVGLAPLIRGALAGDAGPTLTIVIGHDTDVASLGGLLGVHWQVPGFAADDPSPGGALILERVVDARGRRFVRVAYRSQTLDQIRTLSPTTPVRAALPVGRCDAAARCPLDGLAAMLG